MRLIRNRNLTWAATAETFLVATGRYWSAATYGSVGRGTKPLTPDLLVDFATVLGIPADDLTLLTGVESSTAAPTHDHIAGDTAELIWAARRLTAGQLRQVIDRLD